MRVLLLIVIAGPWWVSLAFALTPLGLGQVEKGSPTQVEDAYPLDYRELDVEGIFSYERIHRGDAFSLESRLEYGFAQNWQARLSAPFLWGTGDTADSGNLGLEILRNFQTESSLLPALALSVAADFPTGGKVSGVDTTVKLLASKILSEEHPSHQLHGNVAWTHNAGPRVDERRDLYLAILGYSRLLGLRSMLIMDYVWQQELEKNRTTNLLEVGIRRLVTSICVLAIGGGVGIGAGSPDYHLQAGIEFTFP